MSELFLLLQTEALKGSATLVVLALTILIRQVLRAAVPNGHILKQALALTMRDLEDCEDRLAELEAQAHKQDNDGG